MKRNFFFPCLLLACLSLTGCQVQPTQQPTGSTTRPVASPAQILSAYTQTLTAALNAVATTRDVGLISQSEINSYKPVVDAAYSARNAADRDIRQGNVSNMQGDLDQVQSAIVQLQPLLNRKLPTTQP